MPPLDELQRRRYLVWSAILCAIPVCLAPLAGRSAFELANERAVFNSRFSTAQIEAPSRDKPVAVARDPFIPDMQGTRKETNGRGIVGLRVTQGEPIGFALPPNAGAAGTPVQDSVSSAPAVTGVVTGSSPRALIDDGTHVRIIGIGDTIAGSRVISIDAAGVRLQNGNALPLAENQP